MDNLNGRRLGLLGFASYSDNISSGAAVLGAHFRLLKNTEVIRKDAAEQRISEEEALERGPEESRKSL